MMSVGDIMSTVGVFGTPGGYHEYTGVFSAPGDTMSTPRVYHGTTVGRKLYLRGMTKRISSSGIFS